MEFLKIVILILLTPWIIGFAYWILAMGHGMGAWLGLILLPVPSWIRWVILIPATILTFFIAIFTFNIIFWIGDWYGESFLGTVWDWVTTFVQASLVPTLLVTNVSLIAPRGRVWIAVATMLLIWLWLVGVFLDPQTGKQGFDLLFHGFILVAALSAAWGVIKVKTMEPLFRLIENEPD